MTGLKDKVEPRPVYLEAALEVLDDEAWQVGGLAVPFGVEYPRYHLESGATRQRIDGATVLDGSQLFYGHDHQMGGLPIGLITKAEAVKGKGVPLTASISKTLKGQEVRTLLKDGVLKKFSIGYLDDQWHVEEDGDLVVHDNVTIFEVSVVARPQLDAADVDTVLHITPQDPTEKEPSTMTETLLAEDAVARIETLSAGQDALNEAFENITRQITTLGTSVDQASTAPCPIPGESYGEFLHMLAQKGGPADEAAAFLAYVGGVVGDLGDWVKDTWVGDIIRVVEKPRHAMDFFDRAPLPESGMGVEYGKVLADTTQVGEQAAEGDVLPYGKITFTTARADLKTYGGWGEMSLQEIQRSPFNVIETFFLALARRYGVTTEGAVRARLQAAVGAKTIAGSDLTTADGWITFIVEAAAHLDDKGLSPEGLFVSKDEFINLALLRDGAATDAPRLLNRDSGSISVTGLSGSMFNVPVKMLGTLAPGTVRVADSAAIKSFEASGAPFRLQDGDITNLTQAMSVYGYLAVADQEPDAIVKPGA